MAIRLILTITAAPGKGDELARLYPEIGEEKGTFVQKVLNV
jgi:hypothetical protein